MIGKFLLSFLGAALCAAAVPATAQNNGAGRNLSGAESVNDLGRCLARARTAATERILALPFGSAEQRAAFQAADFRIVSCTGRSDLAFAEPLVVGGMAEEMLRRARARDFAALAAAEVEPLNAEEEIAMCVIRRNPAGVKRLIDSRPSSAAERQALATIMSELAPCVPQSSSVQVQAAMLRSLFAAGAYRLAGAARL